MYRPASDIARGLAADLGIEPLFARSGPLMGRRPGQLVSEAFGDGRGCSGAAARCRCRGPFYKARDPGITERQGLRVVEFDAARSLDDAKKQIRLMGEVTRHPDRASAEIDRLDAAVAHVAAACGAQALSRARGVPTRLGFRRDSLTSSLLANAGLSNAARDLGIKSGGFASLETIINLKPDFILVSDDSGFRRRRRERIPAASGPRAILSGRQSGS